MIDRRTSPIDSSARVADDDIDDPPLTDWWPIESTAAHSREVVERVANQSDHRSPFDNVVSERLSLDARLNPDLEREPMANLHPDRLRPAGVDEQNELNRAWSQDHNPEAWVMKVNPGFLDDAIAGHAGRTTNCAECARAFQSTLEGTPQVAAEISDAGLPAAGAKDGGGESPVYTERWAGTRAEEYSYAAIGEVLLAQGGGSAVVFGFGGEGGHAFNAYYDRNLGRVRCADAQAGEIGDWPPRDIAERFPRTMAILFPPELGLIDKGSANNR